MDIVFSALLLIFSVYLFFMVGAQSPAPTATELGAAFWPRIILVLLIILLAVNIVSSIRKMKPMEGEKALRAKEGGTSPGFQFGEFFRSKLFAGMILVAVMAFVMTYIGFIADCFLFLIAYGVLLGERRPVRLILFSLIITAILYVLFQGALAIMLARGVGVFRQFSLFFETLLPF